MNCKNKVALHNNGFLLMIELSGYSFPISKLITTMMCIMKYTQQTCKAIYQIWGIDNSLVSKRSEATGIII